MASPIVRIANPISGDNGAKAVQLVADFVQSQLQAHRAKYSNAGSPPPLFLGVQGPQGCGEGLNRLYILALTLTELLPL